MHRTGACDNTIFQNKCEDPLVDTAQLIWITQETQCCLEQALNISVRGCCVE